MLEDLPIKVAFGAEHALDPSRLVWVVAGAIAAAVITRSKVELPRAPYFAYMAALVLTVLSAQLVWLPTERSITSGYPAAVLAIWIVTLTVGGYCGCLLAMARSRDAYGHDGMAWLAFIPLANLWLLLKRSRNEHSSNRMPTIPLITGWAGILTGFMATAATIALYTYMGVQFQAAEQDFESELSSQEVSVEDVLRTNSLEETLQILATSTPTPVAVDEVTVLSRIEGDGAMLRRTFSVDLVGMEMTEEFQSLILETVCDWSPFQKILRAGATIEENYVESTGRKIGTVLITRTECGF